MTQDDEGRYRYEREVMVREQLEGRGINDPRVLEAFAHIPRHLFVPPDAKSASYTDRPIQIGPEQTISQPFVVARMMEVLGLRPMDRVLEVGTGSGYQTALLSGLVREVCSIDIDAGLVERARHNLLRLGIRNCFLTVGNGWEGLPQHAPFDKIIVSAAAPEIPRPLIRQLGPEGRLVLPLGDEESQTLVLIERTPDGLRETDLGAVRFVRLRQSEK